MSEQEKREVRREAHEAGVEGASKMTVEDSKEAVKKVQQGSEPQEAKQPAKQA